MKIAVFVDGKNFYAGWRERAAGRRLNFSALSDWLVERAGGSVLAGCHYYTGIAPSAEHALDGDRRLASFLDMLELQRGFFVYRFPRRPGSYHCEDCGAEAQIWQEKEVDTTMVADMLRLAAVGAFDAMVLVSGDADHAPAVEGVRALGKFAYVSTWGGVGLSMRLRRAAFDHIDLLGGIAEFEDPLLDWETENSEGASYDESEIQAVLLEAFVEQLRAAQERFDSGYVGANYFVTRWRGPGFEATPYEKRRALDLLAREGVVEIYEVGTEKAIRIRDSVQSN